MTGEAANAQGPHRAEVGWAELASYRIGKSRSDGLTQLREAGDGRGTLDPLSDVMGFELVAVEPGSLTMRCVVAPWQINAVGMAHGAVLFSLMDEASGLAIFTALQADEIPPHISASYRFVQSAGVGIVLLCRGDVVHRSRRSRVRGARCAPRWASSSRPATSRTRSCVHGRTADAAVLHPSTRSNTAASPCPPPMHIVSSA